MNRQQLNQSLSELVCVLLETGIYEDSHWFHWYNASSEDISSQDIRNVISNIDDMDQIMNLVRPYVIETFKKVADDLEKEGK